MKTVLNEPNQCSSFSFRSFSVTQTDRFVNLFTHSLAATFLFLLVLQSGCDEGLAPPEANEQPTPTASSFSGTVTFAGWSAVDSLYDLRLVAFTVFPPADVINEVLQGRAVVYPAIGGESFAMRGADSVSYTLELAPGVYPYIAVAHRFGPNLFADWRPVGQYDLDTNLTVPSPVEVIAGMNTSGINIHVDFENPPPDPTHARE